MKTNHNNRNRVKAGALYFAIFISFLCGVFAVFLLLSSYLNSKIVNNELYKEKTIHNVNSAIVLLQGNPEIIEHGRQREIDLFKDGQSPVTVGRKRFGVYDVVFAKAAIRSYIHKKIALTGENMQEGEQTGLYMTDRGKYLSISGDTRLTGTCYLPSLGIRRAYIEGKGFKGDKLVDGTTKKSSKMLPEIDKQLFDCLTGYMEGNYKSTDSVVDFNEIKRGDVYRSFQLDMLVFNSEEIIEIQNNDISGNISIRSNKGILVKSRAKLQDVILYAPNIYIEPGFSGSIQAYASDTLVVGNNCQLNYPSFVGIINKNVNNCYMRVEKNSNMAGGIIIYQDSKALKEPELYIEESVVIYGQVYCNGIVEHKGTVYGTLYCNGFLLKTPSAFYENHLLDARVDRKNLSGYFTGACLLKNGNKSQRLIKWLN